MNEEFEKCVIRWLGSSAAAHTQQHSCCCLKIGQWGFLFCSEPRGILSSWVNGTQDLYKCVAWVAESVLFLVDDQGGIGMPHSCRLYPTGVKYSSHSTVHPSKHHTFFDCFIWSLFAYCDIIECVTLKILEKISLLLTLDAHSKLLSIIHGF